MSIYGVTNSTIARPATQIPLRDSGRTQTQPGSKGIQIPVATPGTLGVPKTVVAKPSQQSVPVEAPAGTDPALWSVLSAEERGFFAKAGAMGPLTYGRAMREMKTAEMPASRGGRLDVKI
jgi:hypothetical protein